MNFEELAEFQNERKLLARKYRSLPEDLLEFQYVVSVVPLGNRIHFKVPLGNRIHFKVIAQNNNASIVKARLFCRYLKESSLRIIYSYFEQEQRIVFIEIYRKGIKKNEDRKRVRAYLTRYQS